MACSCMDLATLQSGNFNCKRILQNARNGLAYWHHQIVHLPNRGLMRIGQILLGRCGCNVKWILIGWSQVRSSAPSRTFHWGISVKKLPFLLRFICTALKDSPGWGQKIIKETKYQNAQQVKLVAFLSELLVLLTSPLQASAAYFWETFY